MADMEKSEQPQANGMENGLDDDEKMKLRPADIEADVKEMERRKRVEMIMGSKLFREELERIIELQMKDGNGPAGLLQQISDMMGIQSGKLHTTHMFRGSNCVTPINDIRGVESMGYDKGEKNLRCKLASVFRLMDLYGWSQGINNQITARLNQDAEHFLVNPHGMLFNEITASSLVKVDMQGNIVEPGTTNFTVHTQGFLLHSAIHASRPDVNCVIHIKTPSVLAISSLKCGLLPLCQESLVIGEVSQHPFLCGIFEPEEREKIIRNLGPHNKVLLLHNHGAICCGATVEEAFYNVYNTVLACETQVKLMPIGIDNLVLVNDETRKQVYDAAHKAPDVGAAGDKKKQFRVGEMEFEALIRMLDNAGFRTGYIYRHPLVKGDLPKPKNDVEVPPAVSSLGYLIEQEELYKQGNWKKYIDGRNRLDRTKWLNSPNVYQKVEILETGTSDPKKITKWVDQNSEEWVAESSPTHSSTPVKIDSALQFVPKGTNPKEFKKLQQQIKENRRADKITSGPQSHILEGVSWEDAKKLQDANITQTGDQVILVGAASKGIIQRNYQHHALVYKTPYAKNPFDSMSDKEIEDYKQLVERKQRGDTDYEESQSESEAISSSRQDALRHLKSPLLSPQSATSETEEESRDEPRVLRIETKTAPRPIQAEVVLSDAESDSTDARVERSHSARYPKAEKPESVNLMNSFRKSWSLKREKDKSKDADNPEAPVTRNLHPSLILSDYEKEHSETFHHCIARIKQLTYKPVIVDVESNEIKPLLKSASDPSNLSTCFDTNYAESPLPKVTKDLNTSLSCSNIENISELQKRLHTRKKLLHSAKMKFLGLNDEGSNRKVEVPDLSKTSPMCALISEIRETLSEIMSPERYRRAEKSVDDFFSLRWIQRPNFKTKTSDDSDCNISGSLDKEEKKSRITPNKSLDQNDSSIFDKQVRTESLDEFKKDFQILAPDNFKAEDTANSGSESNCLNCSCAIHANALENLTKPKVDENQNEECLQKLSAEVKTFSDEEATYTITDDSLLQTYSFTETTETEWYYEKTILKPENSQTVLEIKEQTNKENLEASSVKYIDTGIDTDFTSEKDKNDFNSENLKETETAEDFDAPLCENSGLNKSSETDSSFLKNSSGRTSNDVDTSFAFKTETENSEKGNVSILPSDKSLKGKRKFLEGMLGKTKETGDESSDSREAKQNEEEFQEGNKSNKVETIQKLPGIPESPEFTNIDTEDAPATSSSKDTSPEIPGNNALLTDEILDTTKEPEVEMTECEFPKVERKKKKGSGKNLKKSSTKITVKKELKEKNCDEPVVSEIKLTIKNSNTCQSEKYEVKIQDVTNTSEELSRSVSSVGENVETLESFEIVDGVCDCDAQQNLEDLQGEVTCAIEKLHSVEEYFEDEIKKHCDLESGKKNGDELFIEYRYREYEEIMNDCRGEIETEVAKECKENLEKDENITFFMSSLLDNICGEVEVGEINQERLGRLSERLETDVQSGEAFPNKKNSSLISKEEVELNNLESEISGFWEAKNEESTNVSKENRIPENWENHQCKTVDEGTALVLTEGCEVLNNRDTLSEERIGLVSEGGENESDSLENLVKNELQKSGVKFSTFWETENEEDTENSQFEDALNNQDNPIDKSSNLIEKEDLQKTDTQIESVFGVTHMEGSNEFSEKKEFQNLEKEFSSFEAVKPEESNFEDTISDNNLIEEGVCTTKFEEDSQKSRIEVVLEAKEDANNELLLEKGSVNPEIKLCSFEEIKTEAPNHKINENLILENKKIFEDLKDAETRLDFAVNFRKINDNLEVVKETELVENFAEKESQEYCTDASEFCKVKKDVHGKAENLEADFPSNEDEFIGGEENSTKIITVISNQDQKEIFETCKVKSEIETEMLMDEEHLNSHVNDKEFQEIKNEDCGNDGKQTSILEPLSKKQVDVFEKSEKELESNEELKNKIDQDQEVVFTNVSRKELESENSVSVEEKEKMLEELDNSIPKIYLNFDALCFRPVFSEESKLEKSPNDCDESKISLQFRAEEVERKSESIGGEKEVGQLTVDPPYSTGDTEKEPLSEFGEPNFVILDEPQEPKLYENIQLLLFLKFIRKKQSLKAITWHSGEPPRTLTLQGIEPVEYVLNCLLNSVTNKVIPTVNDVINFILVNEESPVDSLAEFEDLENLISNSVVAELIDSVESQLEGDIESLPDEEDMREKDDLKIPLKKHKKKDAMFKVTIATPSKKEIFINYSEDNSSTFNISDFELCNSYIKTDDVNEDFDNLSSDNLDFFSLVGSPGKTSLNSSFSSATSMLDTFANPDQFCCADCEGTPTVKSPRSLAIIQEVDEGENTINGDHSDAHQSTFSHSSKEGSPTKDRSVEDSPKKDKKKKKGLRTPSFLKKKKEKKKIAESA